LHRIIHAQKMTMTIRPTSTWFPSPNYRTGRSKPITCVVIHATATAAIESPRDWLSNPASKVSAHYLIGTDGAIYHMVHESDTAWHAGESEWRGEKNVNDFGIGIELVNSNDGKMAYPEAQLISCAALVKDICSDYKIEFENVIGHLDIAPGRKTDPAGFPWDDFRARLNV
jgi:N-acetylmuramoyl-L-alanine amidase